MEDFKLRFINNFITDDRWRYITYGLWVTLKITFFAALIGIAIGFVVAVIRSTHDRTGKLKFLDALCRIYLTVIRGTPVVVQLMIMVFIIFSKAPMDLTIYVAMLAFGINSGAYVAEIVRGGITVSYTHLSLLLNRKATELL